MTKDNKIIGYSIKHPEYLGQELHKKGFRVWALYMFRLIEGRTFIEEELHKGLFETFEAIYKQEEIRQNINVPPRSGKTTLARYFIAYCLAKNPRCQFIYTSYSQDLLSDISRELAAVLQHPIYHAMYQEKVEEEAVEEKPIDDFWRGYLKSTQGKAIYTSRKIITASGGVILFTSIGSAITGFGAGIRSSQSFSGCLFIDDANKPADVNSQLMRDKVQGYFVNTLITRLSHSEVAIVNIQQRLHLEDMSGYLIKEYDFKTLKRALVVDGVCQLPSQYSEKRLKEISKNDFMFMSQYQQEPVMEGGNLFSKEAIGEIDRIDLPSKFDFTFITADLSYKDKEVNDFTAFSYWGVLKEEVRGKKRDHLYLIDVKRKRINAVDVDNWIEPWIKNKLGYGFRYIWIEDKSHGIYLNQSYRRKGLPVPDEKKLKDTLPRDRDKVTRANNIIPALDTIDNNLILCKDIENYTDLISEVLAFPNSKHDDFVDTLIDAAKIALLPKRVSFLDI